MDDVKEFAEEVDRGAALRGGMGLMNFWRRHALRVVVRGDLRSSRAGIEALASPVSCATQATACALVFRYGSSGKEQIADESIAEIAFQAGDAPKPGMNPRRFGEGKARHFVGDNHVAGQASSSPPPRQAP